MDDQIKRYKVSVGLAIAGALLFALPEAIIPPQVVFNVVMSTANAPNWLVIWAWATLISGYLGAALMGAAVGNCVRHWLLGAIAGILLLIALGVFLNHCLWPAIYKSIRSQ